MDTRQRRIIVIVLLGLVVVVGIVTSGKGVQTKQDGHYDLGFFEERRIKAAVADMLREPESARFGRISAIRVSKGDIAVCGWVNGKNAFGGMAGESPFYVPLYQSGQVGVPWLSDAKIVARRCEEVGLFSPVIAAAIRGD